MSNFSPHKNTFLSIEISQYWLYVNTPAQILWRISKPGRLSWTCPWYSFENLHAPTSPLKRRPLLLASLRKPEIKWENKLSLCTWIYTGCNFSKKKLLVNLSINIFQKVKLKVIQMLLFYASIGLTSNGKPIDLLVHGYTNGNLFSIQLVFFENHSAAEPTMMNFSTFRIFLILLDLFMIQVKPNTTEK